MAASLQTKIVLPVLSTLKLPYLELVRWKSRGLFVRRKKPIKKWFDPKDTSWAEPILKHKKLKESQPEPEPSMLHMVYRMKSHYTRPYWEKDILKEYGLFEKAYNPVVLKNTPEINEKLRIVKHLICIKPITFPYGLPKDEKDYKHCYLKENGEFIVRHRINDESDEVAQAWAEVRVVEEQEEEEDIWKMDKETIQREARKTLLTYRLSQEYFREKYVYKYNQDGKEHRYSGKDRIASHRQDWY
ncbi:39S ribosomal protein L30 mitochondrial [Biomphalaria glabrata]|nr:CARP-L30 [Biomphalaria glabrata]